MRFAIAGSCLSAVADRIGWWGKAASPGVVWGNFTAFLEYTQHLNPWAPTSVSNFLGYVATGLEIILSFLFIFCLKLRLTSFVSFALLMVFALSMTFVIGIKAPFDYSVFTAAAGSLLLYTFSETNSETYSVAAPGMSKCK